MGRRKYFGPDITLRHNVPLAVIGASFLWLGWYGFNAGGAYVAGTLTFNTLLATHMASAKLRVDAVNIATSAKGENAIVHSSS